MNLKTHKKNYVHLILCTGNFNNASADFMKKMVKSCDEHINDLVNLFSNYFFSPNQFLHLHLDQSYTVAIN